MLRSLLLSLLLAVFAFSQTAQATPYNLTNAANTTVKYEAKQVGTNSDSANSIVRSLGLVSNPTYGILNDAALNTITGSGVAFSNVFFGNVANSDNGNDGNCDLITQGGNAIDSTLDLTFNAASGQTFSVGDLRVNTTLYGDAGATGLWPVGSYLAWQVSTDGGTSFTNILSRTYTTDLGRADSGVLSIPGINGFSSIIVRGRINSLGSTTNSHWQLIDTPPFTTGTFAGGLEINLTTVSVPEPASLTLVALGAFSIFRAVRKRHVAMHR